MVNEIKKKKEKSKKRTGQELVKYSTLMGFVPFIVHPAQQQQLRPFDTRVIAASNQRTGFGKEEGASLLPRVRSKPSRKLVHFLISTFWGDFFLTYDDKVCDGVFLRMACLG